MSMNQKDIGTKLLSFQKSKTIERFVNFHT
jgi:hypothetical protein